MAGSKPVISKKTRENAYKLTPRGEELVKIIVPVRLDVQKQLLSKLSDAEINILISLCDKLQLAPAEAE